MGLIKLAYIESPLQKNFNFLLGNLEMFSFMSFRVSQVFLSGLLKAFMEKKG
jgi:hypothetical protein